MTLPATDGDLRAAVDRMTRRVNHLERANLDLHRERDIERSHAETYCAAMKAAGAELDRLRQELSKVADWVERDRREPDKILCHVQSLRREAHAMRQERGPDA